MAQEDRSYVKRILQLQRSTLELVVVAVVLAFGINVASSALPQALSLSNTSTLALGTSLCLLSLGYLVHRLSSALSKSIKLKGVLLLGERNVVKAIGRYRFSESTASHVVGLTAENKALGHSWERSDLGLCFEGKSDPEQRHTQTGHRLAHEAVEYFVLDELSLHLSAYFDSEREVSEETVSRIKRRDIPQILLDNRFLELFSKPMAEREAFKDHTDEDSVHVVSAWGADGEVFDQFELILPKGSTLSRIDGVLQVKTSRFTLQIKSSYEGFSTNLPTDFEKFYLGVPFNTYSPHQVELELAVKFSWWSLLSPRGWDYYEWLDSFVEKIDQAFCFHTFAREVGWQTAHSVALAFRHAEQSGTADAG